MNSPTQPTGGVLPATESDKHCQAVVALAQELDAAAPHITQSGAHDFASRFRVLAVRFRVLAGLDGFDAGTCLTCNGNGLIGGWTGGVEGGYDSEPCPDCATAEPGQAAPATLQDFMESFDASEAFRATMTARMNIAALEAVIDVVIGENKALRAALTPAPAPVPADPVAAWQPIETAPATADQVLLITIGGAMKLETGHYARNMLHASKVDGEECYFTHWAPLPAAPLHAEGGK